MHEAWRIIDTNANRAREGVRVLEDVARFVLESGPLAERCKMVRHAISEAVMLAGGDAARLLAWRDAATDVGAGIKVDGELTRADLSSVVDANAGRAAEALRVLEEMTKIAGSAEARSMLERARYEVYEVHRMIGSALGADERFQPRVCVLLSEALCLHHSWQSVAELAIDGGAEMLQLREKELADSVMLARARWLVGLCRERGARCVINDRVDIAMLAGAWGVHVGQDDLSVREVRRLAGRSLRVGVSTETLEEALKAVGEGADLCGVGPMFATTTKDKPRLAGPAHLRDYLGDALTARVPHLAIGGISPANVSELVALGCRGVAVSSAVCEAAHPGEIVGAIFSAMNISSERTGRADRRTTDHRAGRASDLAE